jgi:hypothetical protein
MTLSKGSREVLETPKGTGYVRRENQVVARVSYDLCVEIVEMFARPFRPGKQARLAHKVVTGVLSVLEGELAPPGSPGARSGPFTLVMQDSREVDFHVDRFTPESRPTRQQCTISGSGNRL